MAAAANVPPAPPTSIRASLLLDPLPPTYIHRMASRGTAFLPSSQLASGFLPPSYTTPSIATAVAPSGQPKQPALAAGLAACWPDPQTQFMPPHRYHCSAAARDSAHSTERTTLTPHQHPTPVPCRLVWESPSPTLPCGPQPHGCKAFSCWAGLGLPSVLSSVSSNHCHQSLCPNFATPHSLLLLFVLPTPFLAPAHDVHSFVSRPLHTLTAPHCPGLLSPAASTNEHPALHPAPLHPAPSHSTPFRWLLPSAGQPDVD